MEKEGKVMILSYMKGMEQHLVGENKEQSVGAITRELLKEEHMGLCHSHNVLCKCVFVGDVADGVKEVAMRKSSKCEVDKDERGLFMQLL